MPSMVRAIARQAEAERERRAKVIHAEGEKQAAQSLLEAAQMLSREPAAMQLRYLQTRRRAPRRVGLSGQQSRRQRHPSP